MIVGILLAVPLFLVLRHGIFLGTMHTVQLVDGVPTTIERCRYFTQLGTTLRDKLPAKGADEAHC